MRDVAIVYQVIYEFAFERQYWPIGRASCVNYINTLMTETLHDDL